MYCGKKIIGIIPARSGSKGIFNKNMQILGKRSLIGHAAFLLNSIDWVDTKVISTDSPAYASEAKKYGLTFYSLRPYELSTDEAQSIDVIKQIWKQSEINENCLYDFGLILEPTSPLRSLNDIERCMRAQLVGQQGCTFTVSETPAHFTFEKAIKLKKIQKRFFYRKKQLSILIVTISPNIIIETGFAIVCHVNKFLKLDALLKKIVWV